MCMHLHVQVHKYASLMLRTRKKKRLPLQSKAAMQRNRNTVSLGKRVGKIAGQEHLQGTQGSAGCAKGSRKVP